MRKRIIVVAVAIMFAINLCACGNSSTVNSENNNVSSTEKTVNDENDDNKVYSQVEDKQSDEKENSSANKTENGAKNNTENSTENSTETIKPEENKPTEKVEQDEKAQGVGKLTKYGHMSTGDSSIDAYLNLSFDDVKKYVCANDGNVLCYAGFVDGVYAGCVTVLPGIGTFFDDSYVFKYVGNGTYEQAHDYEMLGCDPSDTVFMGHFDEFDNVIYEKPVHDYFLFNQLSEFEEPGVNNILKDYSYIDVNEDTYINVAVYSDTYSSEANNWQYEEYSTVYNRDYTFVY